MDQVGSKTKTDRQFELLDKRLIDIEGKIDKLRRELRTYSGAQVAFDNLATEIGGGLRAIALALSTPQDNSTAVQKIIDDYAAQLKASTDKVEDAIKSQSKETK